MLTQIYFSNSKQQQNYEKVGNDDDWHCSSESEYDSEEDYGYEDEKPVRLSRRSTDYKFHHLELAAVLLVTSTIVSYFCILW